MLSFSQLKMVKKKTSQILLSLTKIRIRMDYERIVYDWYEFKLFVPATGLKLGPSNGQKRPFAGILENKCC